MLPALRANSCIAIDRLMIELLDFHIPFLSFTNAGFKGYGTHILQEGMHTLQAHTERNTNLLHKKAIALQMFGACISSGMGDT